MPAEAGILRGKVFREGDGSAGCNTSLDAQPLAVRIPARMGPTGDEVRMTKKPGPGYFILSAFDRDQRCPVLESLFRTDDIAALQSILGDPARDDSELRGNYTLDHSELDAIVASREHVSSRLSRAHPDERPLTAHQGTARVRGRCDSLPLVGERRKVSLELAHQGGLIAVGTARRGCKFKGVSPCLGLECAPPPAGDPGESRLQPSASL